MPDFKKVLWDSAINKLNTKKPPAVVLEVIELQVADAAVDRMHSNHRLWLGYVAGQKRGIKEFIPYCTKMLNGLSNADEAEYQRVIKEIRFCRTRAKQSVMDLDTQNKAYSEAFADDGFRANDLYAVMNKKKIFDVVTKEEVKRKIEAKLKKRAAVITADRAALADRKRIEEYLTRLETIEDAALESFGQAKLHKSKFEAHMKTIDNLFDGEDGIDRLIERLKQKVQQGFDAAQQKNEALYEAKLKLGDGELPAFRQNLAGKIKTALLSHQSQSKVYGKQIYARIPLGKVEKRIKDAAVEAKALKDFVDTYKKRMQALRMQFNERN